MKNLYFLTIVSMLLFSTNVNAQTSEQIEQVENYLNNIKTLSARFVQNASNGSMAEGQIFVAKPNKIRMEYADPDNILIVGNGDYIVYNDKELDQVTNIDYDDVPASLLLANNVKIDGQNIKVKKFSEDAGGMSMSLEYAKANTGPITLVFSKQPFELKQWKIVDQQGVEVSVSLYNQVVDETIEKDKFKFKREKNKKNSSIRKK